MQFFVLFEDLFVLLLEFSFKHEILCRNFFLFFYTIPDIRWLLFSMDLQTFLLKELVQICVFVHLPIHEFIGFLIGKS